VRLSLGFFKPEVTILGADIAGRVEAVGVEISQFKPVIDRLYPLEEVPDAVRYLEEGHSSGKIVLNIK
jgi:NADPH:quinone reductase-like Zn-dependent oxidoreductase